MSESNPGVLSGPIPITRVRGMDRRAFVSQGTLAAVAAVLTGACMGGGATAPHVSLVVQLANFPALDSVGGVARVDHGNGSPVAAVRTGTASFAAFSLICPHFGCTVGVVGTHFQCPCHGAQFSSAGTWIGGQPTSNLTALTVKYDATAGTLTITG